MYDVTFPCLDLTSPFFLETHVQEDVEAYYEAYLCLTMMFAASDLKVGLIIYRVGRLYMYVHVWTQSRHIVYKCKKHKNVWRCRDSRTAKSRKTSRDDGIKQFSIQPHLT